MKNFILMCFVVVLSSCSTCNKGTTAADSSAHETTVDTDSSKKSETANSDASKKIIKTAPNDKPKTVDAHDAAWHEFDEQINSYELLVDQYIALHKAADGGDTSATRKYKSAMKEISASQRSLDNNKAEMRDLYQRQRLDDLEMKVANAVYGNY